MHYIDVQGKKYKQNNKEVLRALGVKPVMSKHSLPISRRKQAANSLIGKIALVVILFISFSGITVFILDIAGSFATSNF